MEESNKASPEMESPWGPKPLMAKMETGHVAPIIPNSHHSNPPITTLYGCTRVAQERPLRFLLAIVIIFNTQNKASLSYPPQSFLQPICDCAPPPMKKLYRKGTVHPSPPAVVSDQHLAFLPSAILTLAAALSPEEREVLDYLLSCSGTYTGGNRKTIAPKSGDHPPLFNCNCFRCYMSYWVKWDSSPNRQLIHEIIDAFEDGLVQSKNPKSRKERRRKGCSGSVELKQSELDSGKDELGRSESMAETRIGGGDCEKCGVDGEEGSEKGSVRTFVSFLGERIWGVLTQ